MGPTFVITRTDQLKAMSEPLRIRLVESLVPQERTIADLAKRLGQPASKLYHHIDILLSAGLIQVTRRVRRRGTEERWFRAVAKDYTVDDSIFAFDDAEAPGPEAVIDLAEGVFRGASEELKMAARSRAIDPRRPGRRCFLETQALQLSEADFGELCDRLDRWIDEAKGRHSGRKAVSYRFVTAFFPTKGTSARR